MAVTVPEPRAQRWARIRAERREQILAGACGVFAMHGVEHASMAMVAEACEATKVTVYAHFRSKDALVAAVLQRWMLSVEGALGQGAAGAHGTLPALLCTTADRVTQVAGGEAYRSLARAMQAPGHVPGQIKVRWVHRFDHMLTRLAAAFRAQGAPDASAHAALFLALLERADGTQDVGAIVRLFLAAYTGHAAGAVQG